MTMMRSMVAALAVAALVAPAAATASWSMRPAAQESKVSRGRMAVTPAIAWNEWSEHQTKYTEVWTLDGLGLNELAFFGGVDAGKTLFRRRDDKYDPLPKFRADMLLSDIPELFETSARIVLRSSAFEIDAVAPAKLSGHDAVRFGYRYTVQDEEIVRRGEGHAAIVGGRLYMITFEAPQIYYFDRDIERVRAIVASARILK
ncbi:MAG: hypothetical protein GW859_04450 [Sphingomonadales bacterium]|nr:hypothetical protein [Sphingomonadales bacterium]